ncbi:MAG: Stk1 family PASTA domain-containing Ser/Thr kinase [Thermoleophilia bacterium]|nr:Stk1 family PASTA domain-containing Ser/Thr kinase [Thermoleophilia bacterium]
MSDVFQEGQVVNERYRVLRKLGGGGMADVYLGEDLTLGRRVALKVLLQRFLGDAQFIERFRREAKAAAGLNHPGIVAIYDWGQVGGTPYIVMEYVEGETLKDLIRRRGRLGGAEAVDLTLGLLAGVELAHRHGIIHRDIKAQNILIDRNGAAKITDFGIARAGDSGMTEAGSILGTAQYLSPEQARGLPVDERSDLYSVGVVLYEMLTGRVPFSGDSAVNVAMQHVNELPEEPVTLVPGMPTSLNQIVLRALAKDPDHRYASAAEFAADLRAARAGAPVAAAGFDPEAERTQFVGAATAAGATRVMTPAAEAAEEEKKRRRWPLFLILGALVALALVGYFAWASVSGDKVEVPNVVGLTEDAAVRRLEDAGFKVAVQEEFSEEFAAGFVSRQSPPGGTKMAEGETVDVWVSGGSQTVELPDFRGWDEGDVADWLRENGLEGDRKTGRSDDVAEGRVYRQDPAAGEAVERGSTVVFWVSTGEPKAVVPDLVGMTQADAIAALTEAGLAVGEVTTQASTEIEAGRVMAQDPPFDTKVERGSRVAIVLSTGPEPTPTPTPTATVVQVPGVYGMDLTTATERLESMGFVVDVRTEASPEPDGTVIAQDPEAETLAAWGSTVRITVAE